MKKSFHVFFLFVLFAFFAAAQSWAYVNNIVTVPGGKITTGYTNASEGETVDLLISPDPGYVFAGLEVKEDVTGNDVAVVVSDMWATYTMPASNVTVTPSWAHSVTIYNYTGGTVAADKVIASKDETVTLTVSPDKGYVLQKLDLWNEITDETVELVVSNGKASFTMPEANVTVTSYWNELYSVNIANVVGGTVTTDKDYAAQGDDVTLTITANTENDYLIAELKVMCGENLRAIPEVSDGKASFTMPACDVSVIPSWTQATRNVTIESVVGGTVAKDKRDYTYGETVTLTITPSEHYLFKGVEVTYGTNNKVTVNTDGVNAATGGEATFTMPKSDVTVKPSWEQLLGVGISSATGGKVTADKDYAKQGETVTLTISPDADYLFKSLEVKDAAENVVAVTLSEDKSSATFTMPAFGVIVTSSWVRVYSVSIDNKTGGTVTTNKTTALAGETVTLTISPDVENDYELTSIGVYKGNGFVDVNVSDGKATFTMPDRDVTVYPYWTQAMRYVTIENVTGGTVAQGKGNYTYGETVTLTISPSEHYLFKGVEVTYGTNNKVTVNTDGVNAATGGEATFTMPKSDVTVKPSWEQLFGVGISSATGGKVTADKDYAKQGETVTLTISPDADYLFKSLEVKDAAENAVAVTLSEDNSSATFSMPASGVTVMPSFAKVVHSVTVTKVTGGTIETDKTTATQGTTVTLTIKPDVANDYVFKSLEVEDAAGNTVNVATVNSTTKTFTMPASDVTVTSTWAKVERSVTIVNVTGGMLTTDNATATYGETVTLTISPDVENDYELASIGVYKGNGFVDVNVSDGKATFTMPDRNVTVYPSWAQTTRYVTIENVTGGTVAKDKGDYTYGETVSLTITPSEHYLFKGVEVTYGTNNKVTVNTDGVNATTGGGATFTMPKSDVTVKPSWEQLFGVGISSATGGKVTADKDYAKQGETVTLTISPDADYLFKSLEVKDAAENAVAVTLSEDKSSAAFTMPASGVTVTSSWVRVSWVRVYSVTIDKKTGGTVTTDKEAALAGETVTLTISPDVENDYELTSIGVYKGDGFVDVNVSDGKATFTMPDRDVTVYPYWTQAMRYVTIENVTGGTVAQGKGNYTYGETVTLTISPDVANGYELASLKVTYGTNGSVNASISDDKTKATFPMPAFDVTVTPSWAKTEYSVTITKVAGGTVTTDKEKAVKDDAVTLTISSDETNDYELTNLEVTYGDNSSVTVTRTDNTATFWMPAANVTVTPSWAKVEHSVIITNVTGGMLTTDKEKTTYGETVTLTIAPTSGYQFNSLTVKDAAGNAVDVTLSNNKTSATFSMPKSDVTVTPSWNAVLVDDGEGGLYVNMPETGTKTVDIPKNVVSFKVYDDGGKDENYDVMANGYLVLNAPEGYQLQVTGTARYAYGKLAIYDGDSEAKKLFNGDAFADDGIDVGTIRNSGDKLTIYFRSMKATEGTSLSGLDLTVSLVKVDFGAVSIAKADDGKIHATINGDYAGKDALDISEAIEVDAVDYNRELEVDVPVTALLPVTLPAGTTVNAEFYTLEKVEQVEGMKWQATMKYIGDGNLPQPNTPYAVILPTGQSELKFDLPSGKKATVQTGDINKVCGVDASCKLDKNGKITDDWFFTGTYAYKEWKEDDEELGLAYAFSANDNPGGAAKGKFGKIKIDENSSEYPRAKAMRCYLRKRDANVKLQQQNQAQMVAASPYVAKFSINNLPETIDVEFVKDDAKGGRTVLHGRMNTVTGEFKMLRDYDLKGRKVNSTNRARGAYYGKKVMKK